MDFENLLKFKPYELQAERKVKLLTDRLSALTKHHRVKCQEYNAILECMGSEDHGLDFYEDIPFLPVRLFKELPLKSVSDEEIIKIMTSSGTTGQAVSNIYLDKVTASNQQKAMVKIVSDFTGSSRMPMIVIDCPSVVKNRKTFSARGAGILGFSIFGSAKMYALDDDMNLRWSELKEFIEKYKDRKILLFGFTFMIWQYFYKELNKIKAETGEQLDLSNAIMIHGGGWKKLISEMVSFEEFRDRLTEVCGLSDIHDYYGMVEQTGCIYMQCECGHLHASIFSDVFIRNPKDFSICSHGEKGIIQVVSTIPESYPGHSLLTEDEGVILGEDDCPCGRKGKYFRVLGRLKNAEIRGCSDTYAADQSIKQMMSKEESDQVWQKLSFLTGDRLVLQNIKYVSPLEPFSDTVISFADDLSKELMTDKEANEYADVVTLGFWLRKSSINGLKKRFHNGEREDIRVGRGMALHIAPSNVPVNFAYSLFAGLLMGNANVVRVPSKGFPQVMLIAQLINKVLERYSDLKQYIALVRYDRDFNINALLSSMCDIRIIWGGDATIEEIRSVKLPPRAAEITFADRYSLAVIDSDLYLECKDKRKIAVDFYNETYLSDQNACTSPRVIVWHGSKRDEAKQEFWCNLNAIVQGKYQMEARQSVDKLATACRVAAASETGGIGAVYVVPTGDNLIMRLRVDRLTSDLMEYRGNSGYFYEYDCSNLKELRNFCNDIKCQTLGYIGDVEDFKPLLHSGMKGLDRVVPIGQMMNFDLIWDGYDLYDSMTRVVAVR